MTSYLDSSAARKGKNGELVQRAHAGCIGTQIPHREAGMPVCREALRSMRGVSCKGSLVWISRS